MKKNEIKTMEEIKEEFDQVFEDNKSVIGFSSEEVIAFLKTDEGLKAQRKYDHNDEWK
jgi:cobalamin biosynthesis Co2+ chelatase CbiK